MSADQFAPDYARRSGRRRIRWLVAAHLAAIAAVQAAQPAWSAMRVDVAVSLELAQFTLLAIWFALGKGGWKARLLKNLACVAIVAAANESPAVISSASHNADFFRILLVQGMMTATVWIPAAGGVAVARRWGPRFELVERVPESIDASGTQFSIRSLLLVTLVIALVVVVVVTLKYAYVDPQRARAGLAVFYILAALVVINCGCCGVLAVADVWAGLGVSNLPFRITAAVLVGIVLQMLLFMAFTWKWELGTFAVQAALGVLDQGVVIGSLLVVRSCGYRVISRAARSPEHAQPAGIATAPHPLD